MKLGKNFWIQRYKAKVIKLLQKDFDYVVKALQKKGVDNALLNNLKDLALKTKQKRQEMEDVTAEQNLLSKEFGRYKKENLDISELQEKINALKTKKQELEDEVRTLEDDLNSIIFCHRLKISRYNTCISGVKGHTANVRCIIYNRSYYRIIPA